MMNREVRESQEMMRDRALTPGISRWDMSRVGSKGARKTEMRGVGGGWRKREEGIKMGYTKHELMRTR